MKLETPEWYAAKWVLDKLNQAITEDVKTLAEFARSSVPAQVAAVPFWEAIVEEDRRIRAAVLKLYNTTLEEVYAADIPNS